MKDSSNSDIMKDSSNTDSMKDSSNTDSMKDSIERWSQRSVQSACTFRQAHLKRPKHRNPKLNTSVTHTRTYLNTETQS